MLSPLQRCRAQSGFRMDKGPRARGRNHYYFSIGSAGQHAVPQWWRRIPFLHICSSPQQQTKGPWGLPCLATQMTVVNHDETHLFGSLRFYRRPIAKTEWRSLYTTAFRGSKASYANLFNAYGTFSDKNNQSKILLFCCPYFWAKAVLDVHSHNCKIFVSVFAQGLFWKSYQWCW